MDQQQPPYPPVAPYQQYPPYAPARATNGFAIASMVLGILWLYWVGSILALVFGYVAKRQIRERGESGDGFATAGIVLGWIGVGILSAIVMVFVLASIGSSRSGRERWDSVNTLIKRTSYPVRFLMAAIVLVVAGGGSPPADPRERS